MSSQTLPPPAFELFRVYRWREIRSKALSTHEIGKTIFVLTAPRRVGWCHVVFEFDRVGESVSPSSKYRCLAIGRADRCPHFKDSSFLKGIPVNE